MKALVWVAVAVVVCTIVVGCSDVGPSAASLSRAANLLDNGKYHAADKEMSAAIASDPTNLDTYTTAIALYSDRLRFADAAHVADTLQARLKSGKLTPKPSDEELGSLYLMFGLTYQQARRLDDAQNAYKNALALFPNSPHILNNLGWFYADEGINLNEALRLTKRAASLLPKDGNVVDSLGWAQFKSGRYETSARTLKRAVELEPDNSELRYHLGAAYSRIGKHIEANIELRKALILTPNMTKASLLLKTLQK
ncbi:MAG: tetratricopeptide repeat protein [Armatimonadota bacterium]|nr:tetratricopeptide repeat protein [bacterium]